MIMLDVDTAVTIPVNVAPLIDDTDFKTRKTSVAYNAAGMDLVWNFITSAGVITQTAVTPTTAGVYDWSHIGDGMYKIEIPASGGGSINNDTEGYGWFSGVCDGVLPWRGPTIGFRAAAINDALVDGGDSLDVDFIDAPNATAVTAIQSGLSTHSAADVWAVSTRTLSSYGTLVSDIATAVWGAVTRTLTAASDTSGVTTLLSRLSAARAGYLDELGPTNIPADIDTIAVDVAGLDGEAMRGTDGAYTGTPPAASAIADAVWDETASEHSTTGTVGKTLAELLEDTGTTIPGLFASLNDPTAAAIATAVLGSTIDVLDLQATLKRLLAVVDGVAGVDGSDIAYKAQDGTTTETTHTISASGRAVS